MAHAAKSAVALFDDIRVQPHTRDVRQARWFQLPFFGGGGAGEHGAEVGFCGFVGGGGDDGRGWVEVFGPGEGATRCERAF